MKKYIFSILVATIYVAGSVQTASAQELAFVNSPAILAELPSVRQADAELATLQENMQKRGQDMVKAFQDKVAALQEKIQNGELSSTAQQEQTQALEKERDEIQRYEQEMVSNLQEKRAQLLEPVSKQVNAAIDAVAKERGLKMVFDQGVLLYGESNLDLTSAVKAKLGI